MTRVLPALALSGALLIGACTNPDGTTNVPGTLALGAGALVAGLAIASAADRPRRVERHYYGHPYARPHRYGYGRPHYGYGYGRPRYGYGRPYGWHAGRRW